MDERGVGRSELEEMVASSDYGTAFVAPTVTRDGFLWSFIIHDRDEVIASIDGVTSKPGSEGDGVEAMCTLITVGLDDSRVPVVAFLFKFETAPPEVYSCFMNPSEEYVIALLESFTHQERLFIDLFGDKLHARVDRENSFGDGIREIVECLAEVEPNTDDEFIKAVERLLSRKRDPLTIWNDLDHDSPGTGGGS